MIIIINSILIITFISICYLVYVPNVYYVHNKLPQVQNVMC